MRKDIASKYDICSEMKGTNVVKVGKLPLKEDKLIKPWYLLSVDLCSPWIVKCEFKEPQQIQEVKIWTLTIIDKGSSWPEIAPIENKYVEEIAKLVDDYWFSRYPRFLHCIHDNEVGIYRTATKLWYRPTTDNSQESSKQRIT